MYLSTLRGDSSIHSYIGWVLPSKAYKLITILKEVYEKSIAVPTNCAPATGVAYNLLGQMSDLFINYIYNSCLKTFLREHILKKIVKLSGYFS